MYAKVVSLVLISFVLLNNAFAACSCGILCTCNCSISASTVNFGSGYNPIGSSNQDNNGTFTVSCTSSIIATSINLSSATIKVTTGNSGTFNPRNMTASSANLNYNLYTDATRLIIAGDGTSGTATIPVACSNSCGLLTTCSCSTTATIYGRIPTGQHSVKPSSSYADSITATLTY